MNKHTKIKQNETNSSIKIIEIDWCFIQIWTLKGFKVTMMNMFDGEKQWKFGESQKRNRLSRKIKVGSLGEKKNTSKHVAVKVESHPVGSDFLWPHGLHSPWNSLGQDTGVGNHSLLQGIFPTQGTNPGLPHCRQCFCQLSHQGSPRILEWAAYPF